VLAGPRIKELRLLDSPDDIDLAIVALPAQQERRRVSHVEPSDLAGCKLHRCVHTSSEGVAVRSLA
jgi:hypothetical protein